jgi:hypothetical protein
MLGIIVFVFMMAGLLTMVTVNAGITPAGTVTLNATSPFGVGMGGGSQTGSATVPVNQGTNCVGQTPGSCSGDYTCISTNSTTGLCSGTTSTGLAGQSGCLTFNTNPSSGLSFSGIVSSIKSVPTLIYGGFQQLINWATGNPTNPVNPTQCNGFGTTQGLARTLTNDVFSVVGQEVTQNVVASHINPVVDTTIGIAVVFIGIGLLAGLFGAGILAGIISGVGIVLSMVYYFIGVLNAPNPYNPGTTYFAMPPIFEGVFLGFMAAIMIYMLLSTISKSP